MKVRDIDKIDLNGVLFMHFPDDLSIEESLERLEMEIDEAWEEDGHDPDEEPEISPYWIFRILQRRAASEVAEMSQAERSAELFRIWTARKAAKVTSA